MGTARLKSCHLVSCRLMPCLLVPEPCRTACLANYTSPSIGTTEGARPRVYTLTSSLLSPCWRADKIPIGADQQMPHCYHDLRHARRICTTTYKLRQMPRRRNIPRDHAPIRGFQHQTHGSRSSAPRRDGAAAGPTARERRRGPAPGRARAGLRLQPAGGGADGGVRAPGARVRRRRGPAGVVVPALAQPHGDARRQPGPLLRGPDEPRLRRRRRRLPQRRRRRHPRPVLRLCARPHRVSPTPPTVQCSLLSSLHPPHTCLASLSAVLLHRHRQPGASRVLVHLIRIDK
jgi:hypothetical protein